MIAACADKELAAVRPRTSTGSPRACRSLGFFLEPCLHGREPAEQAIELFFGRYGKRGARRRAGAGAARRPTGRAAADAGPAIKLDFAAVADDVDKTMKMYAPRRRRAAPAVGAPVPRATVDAELLGIFLDEAGEVLQTINDTVPACRAEPDNLDALTTIRRGFHTLKGSGRMVGLMDLGEVAWEIEQLMNALAGAEAPGATPACSS